jgi:polar amino acid transport system substrate-binding protein
LALIPLITPLCAADISQSPPSLPNPNAPRALIIGVDGNSPPFVMQGGSNELYGYDISMMMSLCKMLNQVCTFKVIKWIDLLPAVINNQVDMAVSSITITAERAKVINFSLPYALSYSRFLTRKDTPLNGAFKIDLLNEKNIGVFKGTIYEDQATHMGIKNPNIKIYDNFPESLKALENKDVDFILLDNPTALYWAANCSGAFKVVGTPMPYGFGFGIAVSNKDRGIIPMLNKALLGYQNSKEYNDNYTKYLKQF